MKVVHAVWLGLLVAACSQAANSRIPSAVQVDVHPIGSSSSAPAPSARPTVTGDETVTVWPSGDHLFHVRSLRPLPAGQKRIEGSKNEGAQKNLSSESVIEQDPILSSAYDMSDASEFSNAMVLLERQITDQTPITQRCYYWAAMTEMTIVRKTHSVSTLNAKMASLLEIYRLAANRGESKEKIKLCRDWTIALATELAQVWHIAAVGWGDSRGSRERQYMQGASVLYQVMLDTFTEDEIASFSWPNIPDAARPTSARIKFALASMPTNSNCGDAFETVAALPTIGKLRGPALVGAMNCWEYRVSVMGTRRTPGAPLSADEEKLAAAANAVLRYSLNGSSTLSATDTTMASLYLSRLYFDAGRWADVLSTLAAVEAPIQTFEARQKGGLMILAQRRLLGENPTAQAKSTWETSRNETYSRLCSAGVGDNDPREYRLAMPDLTVPGGSNASNPLRPCEAIERAANPSSWTPKKTTVGISHVARNEVSVVPQVIRWAIALHLPEVQNCYSADVANSENHAAATIGIVVGRDGSVASIKKEPSTNNAVSTCVIKRVASMAFMPPEGGIYSVNASLSFDPEKGIRFDVSSIKPVVDR